MEHDFVRTLKRTTGIIKKEYSNLFSELAKISDENPFSITRPLFCFLNTASEMSSVLNVPPPRIFFNFTSIQAIFDLKEESAKNYSSMLSTAFKREKYKVGIRYHTITRSKVKDVNRIRFTANLVFPDNVDLSHIKSKLGEVRNIILSKLKEVDPDAYETSQKGRLEIWLKRMRVHVMIHKTFEKETISLIRKNFGGMLNHNPNSLRISEDLIEISFRLSFDQVTDYLLSEIEMPCAVPDRYTRMAIEKIYRREFSAAMRYLQMGRNGLLGDFYMMKCREVGSTFFRNKANNCYEKAKINKSDISKGYYNCESKDDVSRALEINSDWIVSLRLFLKARNLQSEISSEELLNEEDLRGKMQLERLYRRYSGLSLNKNLNDFMEEIGNFHSTLLGKLQIKYRIPPQEMLGFDF
ncbi:MAG: hypothetical protein WBA22_06895 [Candidatus Methanofastidiosia archaeon]